MRETIMIKFQDLGKIISAIVQEHEHFEDIDFVEELIERLELMGNEKIKVDLYKGEN